MVIAGVVLFGNAMGLQPATSSARRHGRFDTGDVVGWLITTTVVGGIWGWFMHLATRQNSLLWDEPADRQAAVNHALEAGQLDEDPELRALEFRVAAQRYRGRRFVLCWVAVVLLLCLIGGSASPASTRLRRGIASSWCSLSGWQPSGESS